MLSQSVNGCCLHLGLGMLNTNLSPRILLEVVIQPIVYLLFAGHGEACGHCALLTFGDS